MPGHPMYEVSSMGRVRSWVGWRGRGRASSPRLMQPLRGNGKYLTVTLLGQRSRYVHQLVLEAFIGPRPYPSAVARHLNDMPHDNRLLNLSWGSRAENVEDGKRNGRRYGQPGEQHRTAILTDVRVREIRAWRSYGFTGSEIGAWYGVSKQLVYNVASGRRWGHV